MAVAPATCFQPSPTAAINSVTRLPQIASLKAYSLDDDDEDEGYEIRGDAEGFRPETTFGAEDVPVEQRPSNEYLNLIRQPTFGWASQDSGDSGLIIRLAVIYVALFGLV